MKKQVLMRLASFILCASLLTGCSSIKELVRDEVHEFINEDNEDDEEDLDSDKDDEKEEKEDVEEISEEETTQEETSDSDKTEEQNKEVKQGFSDDELCKMAEQYYEQNNHQKPPIVEVDSEDGNHVSIHLYENMPDHTATWDWYEVDRITGKGTNVLGDEIDLTKVTKKEDTSTVDVEKEVKQIREWYYAIQNMQSSMETADIGDMMGYYDNWATYPLKVVVDAGYDGVKYTREYYYHDEKLFFAFVYGAGEEYRFYFKDDQLIRYIDPQKTVYDNDFGEGADRAEGILQEGNDAYLQMFCSWD